MISILAKFAISVFVPTLSKAISSIMSLPIGATERIIPLPKTLWNTILPTAYLLEEGFAAGFFFAKGSKEPAASILELMAGKGILVAGLLQQF